MPGINADQLSEVTFISGVEADGTLATSSYFSWASATAGDDFSYQAKWGDATAGNGAVVHVYFEETSNWTDLEKGAFTAAMDLWSAIANIKFVASDVEEADVGIVRGDDGTASGGVNFLDKGVVGTKTLGQAEFGTVWIDTSQEGFGPIDAKFSTAAGYVWMTMVHELGHVLGLGHGGTYDAAQGTTTPQHDAYDSRVWTLMSYIDGGDPAYPQSALPFGAVDWGVQGNILSGFYDGVPTTWMPLDIVAAQRLYGAATNSPLTSGGQVFGFHSNIAGDIHNFFDFTVNKQPVITIWDGGAHNTLDVSGYADAADISLEAGSFSSVGGLTNNIAIAFGTRVESAIGGTGNDTIHGNDLSDVLMGGGGRDVIVGGAGNDHIYGNVLTGTAGIVDGNDNIDVGAGMNYANGNAGDDTIVGGDGPNRLLGGQGNDHITAGNGANSINGNLGDDVLVAGNGNDTIRGGQGDDLIRVGSGHSFLMGDLGNDTLYAGAGHDVMTGGGGADYFDFGSRPGSAVISDITDFDFAGGDRISIGTAVTAGHVLHDPGVDLGSEAFAAQTAATLIGTQTGMVAALQVSSDTYLFFNSGGVGNVVHLNGIDAASIDARDFGILA